MGIGNENRFGWKTIDKRIRESSYHDHLPGHFVLIALVSLLGFTLLLITVYSLLKRFNTDLNYSIHV